MPAALRCPHCKKAYRIEKASEDRTFKCRKCGGTIEFAARPDDPALDLKPPPPKRAWWKLSELPGWAAAGIAAAVVGLLAYAAYAGTGGSGEPHDRLFDALADEYDAITGVVEDLDSAEDAEAARIELVGRVTEVNRLLADPRPFGRTRRAVGAALLREYGEAFAARTDRLRDAKADAFERQGVGGAVSRSLTGLPQSLPDLKRALGR